MGYFVFFGILLAVGVAYHYREQIRIGWDALLCEFNRGKDRDKD
jgi:hypothetical protein